MVVASISKKYVLSFVDKSSATLKLVIASVTNKDLKGSTNGSLEQLPVGVSVAPTFFNGKISSIFQLVVAFVANKYKHDDISRHSPTENGLRLLDENNIKLIVDSEGAQFTPATLQVQARNHQTDFQRAASHFNDGRLLDYSIVGFQMVVELIQIPHSEGERNVSKTTSRLIVDHISIPNSEGARRAATKRWLIVENILPGVRVIPNILCEEPHGLIVTSDAPSNIFSQKSKLIVDSIPSYEGALRRAASKLIVICAFDLNKLIKLISASRHQQLIVAYVNMNSKICLIFREECFRTFCEGEWELIGNISPVSFIELAKLIGHVGHIISLGGTIVIVNYNSLLDLLVSLNQWLVGCCIIGLVELLALSNQWLVGHWSR